MAVLDRRSLLAGAATLAVTATSQPLLAADTQLVIMVFPGLQNLPLFAAQAKGIFAKRGLAVDLRFAPGSDELRNGLAEGRYQIVHAAVDNAVHMVEVAKADVMVVSGGDNSFNYLYVQPEIKSWGDLRGKTVIVDAPNTAYAFQLYEMLRQNGLNKGDYEVKSVGGTSVRFAALTKDKSLAASMLNPPFSVQAEKAGMKNMGSAVAALNGYQATGAFVLRAWANANTDTLVKYLQAYIEGVRWTLDAKNRGEATALLVERLKLPEDVAAQSYVVATDAKEGFSRDAQFDLDGFKTVLRLRASMQGAPAGAPEKYVEMSYYQKALAGL